MMKKTMAVLGLALVFAVVAAPADAQQRRQGGMNLDDQMARLTEALDLDEEQSEAVRLVLEGQMERMQEMRSSAGGNREGMRAAMMEIREETNAELAEILSEEQMTKYTEMMAQRRGPPF
jgi:predicted  nucleic acid-binding Zn-ribbon protein